MAPWNLTLRTLSLKLRQLQGGLVSEGCYIVWAAIWLWPSVHHLESSTSGLSGGHATTGFGWPCLACLLGRLQIVPWKAWKRGLCPKSYLKELNDIEWEERPKLVLSRPCGCAWIIHSVCKDSLQARRWFWRMHSRIFADFRLHLSGFIFIKCCIWAPGTKTLTVGFELTLLTVCRSLWLTISLLWAFPSIWRYTRILIWWCYIEVIWSLDCSMMFNVFLGSVCFTSTLLPGAGSTCEAKLQKLYRQEIFFFYGNVQDDLALKSFESFIQNFEIRLARWCRGCLGKCVMQRGSDRRCVQSGLTLLNVKNVKTVGAALWYLCI
jgi:hypothetical protein